MVAGWKYPKGSLFSLNFLSSRGPSVLSFKNSLCSCFPSLSFSFSVSRCSLFFLYKTHTQTNVYNIHVYKYILSLAWNCFFLPSTPSGCINIIRVVCTHIFIYCPVYMRGLYWKNAIPSTFKLSWKNLNSNLNKWRNKTDIYVHKGVYCCEMRKSAYACSEHKTYVPKWMNNGSQKSFYSELFSGLLYLQRSFSVHCSKNIF